MSPITNPDVYLQREAEDPAVTSVGVVEPPSPDGDVVPELDVRTDPRRRKPPPAVISPRFPGFTGTVNDFELAFVIWEEQVRREHPDWSEDAILALAEARYTKATEKRHPELAREYLKLMQVSWAPNRKHIRENIEAAACRRVPEWQELEQLLTSCSAGRPSDRRLPLAIFARSVLCSGKPELRANLKDFAGSNLELDWAFFDTPDMEVNSEHMREESSTRRVMKRMLERNDPDELIRLNLSVLKRLRERGGDGYADIGRYLVVDATPVQAFLDQGPPVNARHAGLAMRGTGATLLHHGSRDNDSDEGGGRDSDSGRDGGDDSGTNEVKRTRKRKPKTWVGWQLLVIADLKSGLPLIWALLPAGPEYTHVVPMLERLMSLAPWLDPEYIVGDSEYDRATRVAFDLQARLGVCPVFPLRDNVGRQWPHGQHQGVPHCSRGGHGAMKLVQSEDFMADSVTVAREPNFARAKKDFMGRSRWACEACKGEGRKIVAATWFRDNARLYTYLPRGGNHKRAAKRHALMLRRNLIEGLFSQLKRRGIGDTGHSNCRWASKEIHVEWLCSAALFAMTVRREAHESGLYETAADEAWARSLLKVRSGTPRRPRP